MPTIRLVPSAYGRSNTNYVTVTNPENMYNNTDHTANYTTLRGRAGRSSNSTYYAFINGFDFSDVPSTATVTGFKVLIRAYRGSYQATGNTNYRICLASQASNSYKIGNTTLSEDIATTSGGTVYEIPTGSLTWDVLKGYGSDFSIDIPLRNSSTSSSNYPYVYVYGAEIEVTYTVPNPRTITSSLIGDGTIVPSGANTYYDGDEYEIVITPTNKSDTVTATKDSVDITSQLVAHYTGGGTVDADLGSYALVSGSFNGSGASYFSGIVGNGVDATQTTSNYYSGGSGTIAVFTYDMAFSLPSNAVVERVYCEVNGHAESTSQSSEYMCAMLVSGGTELTEEINFKDVGTSNTTVTLECETLPTVAQLASMKLQCRLGYYGGAINGATAYVQYSEPGSGVDHYTYTYTVSGDSTIAVVIGTVATDKLYFKNNGSWVAATKAFKKINGSWVEQSDLTTVFISGTNYVKGLAPLVSISGTGRSFSTTASVSYDSSSLTSGSTYHIVGTVIAIDYSSTVLTSNLTVDTDIVYTGSSVSIPFTYTGDSVLTGLTINSSSVTGVKSTSYEFMLTVNLSIYPA